MNKYWFKKILALWTLIILTTACNQNSSSAPHSLSGTEWILDTLNGQAPMASTAITLNFTEDTIGGLASCNSYGGPYKTSAIGEFSVEEIEMTEMDCPQPNGIMEQEQEFINTLVIVESFAIKGENLELLDAAGTALLVFTQREILALDPTALENTNWELETMGSDSLIEGTVISVHISGGRMEGYAGCRDFRATYIAEGDHINFISIEMIGELCAREDFQQQEALFTDYLSYTTHYRLEDNQLELIQENGESLLFLHAEK
jgi:heat shock protein HslJ